MSETRDEKMKKRDKGKKRKQKQIIQKEDKGRTKAIKKLQRKQNVIICQN